MFSFRKTTSTGLRKGFLKSQSLESPGPNKVAGGLESSTDRHPATLVVSEVPLEIESKMVNDRHTGVRPLKGRDSELKE